MQIEEFTDNKTGTLVPIPGGRPDAAYAFVPDPLPPAWTWDPDLWPLLVEAHAQLKGLDGTGKHLPNPDILLRPIEAREARLSSQLEGTITDPKQQALFEADPKFPTSSSDPINALREVSNYVRALRLRSETDLPLSKRLIQQFHEVLMRGVRGYEEQPGAFRTIQNQINYPARFVPPPPQAVPELMDDFERYLHMSGDHHPLVRTFLAHYQFEAIHPFRDGNGRVGRLLLALTIAEWCGLYMSAFFERNKKEYMDLMLRVSTHGDWSAWIRFCLGGVISQARDTEWRCRRLMDLQRDFKQRLTGGSVRLSAIVESLFFNPILTVVRVKDRFNVAYPTARADLTRLEAMGIVEPLPSMPTITYFCPAIFDVTHADAEITEPSGPSPADGPEPSVT